LHCTETAGGGRRHDRSPLDGVLFIDEAYTLSREQGPGPNFGQEAIDQLNADMDREEYRARLVVIVAGYPKEMREFIESNPGLRYRFTQYLQFPDYSAEELLEILRRFAQEDGYKLSAAAEDRAKVYLQTVQEQYGNAFGNARAVRNLFQDMVTRLAERFHVSQGNLDRDTFEADDVPPPLADGPLSAPNGQQDRGTYGNYV
jgi:Cdc6-like AAA superfamily ATPase